MEPVEILDKVIQDYESGRVRWRQFQQGASGPIVGPGVPLMSDGGRCVSQALWAATDPKSFLAYRDAVKALKSHVGCSSVPNWNDDPNLTFSEMLDTLKAVAEKLRSNT